MYHYTNYSLKNSVYNTNNHFNITPKMLQSGPSFGNTLMMKKHTFILWYTYSYQC